MEQTNFDFLFPFQKEGVNYLMEGKKLLSDDVGLGKSIQAISYAEKNNFNKILIITPSPLKQQWAKEIDKFFNDKKVMVLDGTPSQRQKQFKIFNEQNYKYLIVNYEQLNKKNIYLFKQYFDLGIFDEIHKIKNPKTITYKFANFLKLNKKIGLTATPMVNNPQELFNILKFLQPYFMKWWEFSKKFCEWKEICVGRNQYGHLKFVNTISGYKNLDILNETLKKIMIRRKKKDVMPQLPSRSYKNYIIDMTPYQKKIHNIYFTNSEDVFESQNKGDFLAFISMCRMCCNSTELIKISTSNKAIDIEKIESPKLDTLKEILKTINEKVLVFTQFKKMAKIIQRELGIDNCDIITGDTNNKNAVIDDFKKNNKKVLCATDCLNYGISLSEATFLIHFDLCWTPSKIEQREGRIDRITQKNKMLIIKLIMKNSIEHRVLELLDKKTNFFNEIVEGNKNFNQFDIFNEMFKK